MTKRLRILMLNNEYPPLGGGTGTVNQALLLRFAEVPDLEIDLITSALGREQESEEFSEGIHIYRVPVNNRNIHHSSNRELLSYAARALPLAMKHHRKRSYDLAFAWATVPAGAVALALHRLVQLPYLVRVSGPDIPGFERRYGSLYPVLTPTIRAVWQDARIIVAKCEGEANMIRAVDAEHEISIVPNGVDLDAFQPGEPVPDDGPLHLLCVARLIERKGQHHLIQAVQALTDEGLDIRLELIGTGDAEAELQAQVRELGAEDRVLFEGYVPREEIASRYAAAHVFVLPSYNEGMSVATLEAMAAGLPLVVTRTGGTTELVEEGVNGFVFDWADMETLGEHLRHLATDHALARRMGAASRARAASFSWDTAAQRYLSMFADLAAVGTDSAEHSSLDLE